MPGSNPALRPRNCGIKWPALCLLTVIRLACILHAYVFAQTHYGDRRPERGESPQRSEIHWAAHGAGDARASTAT
jgi:hypothetical protein